MDRRQHRSDLPNSADDIDIGGLGRAVKQSFKRVVLATALAGACCVVLLSQMTPRYASETRIIIDNEVPESLRPIGSPDRGDLSKPDKESVTSQVEIIKSKEIANIVAEKLKLYQNPDFNSSLNGNDLIAQVVATLGFGPSTNESEEQRVLSTYYKNLQVYNVKDSRVIAVEFRAADPRLAAQGANLVADVYIERLKSDRMKVDRNAVEVISVEIPKLKAELRDAENELEKFKATTGQLPSSSGTTGTATLNTQRLSEINTRLSDARAIRSDADARAQSIRAMLQTSGQVDASPDVLKSPIIQQLQVQRARIDRQIAEVSASLLPAHPRMLQLRAEQSSLMKQMRDEAQKVVISLENEVRIASVREATLRSEFEQLISNSGTSSDNAAKLRELEGVVKSKREVLEAYTRRDRDQKTRGVATAIPSTASVYSRAIETNTPVFPKTGPITLLVMAATFLLGIGVVVTKALMFGVPAIAATAARQPDGSGSGPGSHGGKRGQFQGGFDSLDPMPAGAYSKPAPQPDGIPAATAASGALSAIPLPGGTPSTAMARAMTFVASDKMIDPPPVIGTLRSVRDHLSMRAGDQPGYRTLITADDDGLEFVTDAIELGKILSDGGKRVVLVDWTIAVKSVSALLPIPRAPGVRELIDGDVGFEAVVHRIAGSNLHAIAPGKTRAESESPEEIESIHLIFDALDETYDHILVMAERPVARRLFELLNGGFDSGVSIGRPGHVVRAADAGEFLGYALPELDIIRFVQQGVTARIPTIDGASLGTNATPS